MTEYHTQVERIANEEDLTIHDAVDRLGKLYDMARPSKEAHEHWLAVYAFLGVMQATARDLIKRDAEKEAAIEDLRKAIGE